MVAGMKIGKAGVGGTSIYGVVFEVVVKRKVLIM